MATLAASGHKDLAISVPSVTRTSKSNHKRTAKQDNIQNNHSSTNQHYSTMESTRPKLAPLSLSDSRSRSPSARHPPEPLRTDVACPLSPSGMELPSPQQRLIFTSPRLVFDDDQLFPAQSHCLLSQPEQRWQYMSGLAGPHHQDGRVLRLSRALTPRSLPAGMPSQAARRVQELHLPPPPPRRRLRHSSFLDRASNRNSSNTQLDGQSRRDKENAQIWGDSEEEDSRLPQWLDVVARTFPNLQHLYLHMAQFASNEKSDESESNAQQLRRLYVLYRLPDLVSIDGVAVTDTERRLARPLSPNGHRVSANDWLKQRLLAQEQEKEQKERAPQPEKRQLTQKSNQRSLFDDVVDEKKESEDTCEVAGLPQNHSLTHKPANVEVDLAGRLTEVALSPPNKRVTEDADLIFETSSSVVTPGCGWVCGQFFRTEEVKKKWGKSRLRFSSSKSRPADATKEMMTTKEEKSVDARLCRKDEVRVSQPENSSPLVKTAARPPGLLPPRLVLDAAKGSPERTSHLVIKSVAPSVPKMPSSPKERVPPSRSLSSPFPIQFRDRSTTINKERNASPPKRTVPSPQREERAPRTEKSLPEPDVSKRSISRAMPRNVSKPLPMQRTQSTPVRKVTNRDLPPPCPCGGGRRFFRTTSSTRRTTKFKKRNARRTSIIDGTDESEEEEEESNLVIETVGSA